MLNSYKSGSTDKEFWTVPDGGHTPAFVEMESPYKQKLLDWMAKQSLACVQFSVR